MSDSASTETLVAPFRELLARIHCAPQLQVESIRAVGHFMGLRYLEVGWLAWQAGGEVWQQGRWFFHYCLSMAPGGR